MLNGDRDRAVALRKQGKSYSQIRELISVPKGTLSYWLRNVELLPEQQKALITRRINFARIGAMKRKTERQSRALGIVNNAKKDIGELTEKDILLIGAVLYWAEGSKQKEHNVSERVCFSNSDPSMIRIFLLWLGKICSVKADQLIYQLYIHETASIDRAKRFWSKYLNIPNDSIVVYLKQNKILSKRKNREDNYYGLLRIVVRRSTQLNRKISGWIEGIYEKWGVV